MINIDLVNFTPLESFFGGICIGIAVILFFVTTGRIAGVSSIVNSSITTNKNWFSNFFFLIGLILGPIFYSIFFNNNIPFYVTTTTPLIIIGGLLVGIGTKIGNGCTSGHGISGISRLSIRSIVATLVFMFVAIFTTTGSRILGIY